MKSYDEKCFYLWEYGETGNKFAGFFKNNTHYFIQCGIHNWYAEENFIPEQKPDLRFYLRIKINI